MITLEQLTECGVASGIAGRILRPLIDTLQRFDINTPPQQAMFIAQAAHESMGFTQTQELLSYGSVDAIFQAFTRLKNSLSRAAAGGLVRNPQGLANVAYANLNGNGGVMSGDGWRFRGGGYLQLTGRANYAAAGVALGRDYEHDPDQVRTQVEDAMLTAGWFYSAAGCIDMDDIVDVTRRINGGLNGLADRQQWLTRTRRALGL